MMEHDYEEVVLVGVDRKKSQRQTLSTDGLLEERMISISEKEKGGEFNSFILATVRGDVDWSK